MCGAVSGAILALNLFFGRSQPGLSLDKNYKMVQKFVDSFKKRFKTINCQELLGCDLGTDEGQKIFSENKLFERCQHFTEEATRMIMSEIEKELLMLKEK